MNPTIELVGAGFGYRANSATPVSPYGPRPETEPARALIKSLIDISFQCRPGELTLLCGASGSGKSSVLRLINGLIPHFNEGDLTGRIEVCGRSVPDLPLAMLGTDSATVFQNPRNQFFTPEVRAELAFRGENEGLDPVVIGQRAQAALAKVKATDLATARFTELSGGQLQKIACAQALASQTPVLLFDEPTSNLAPGAIAEFAALLAELKAAGHTVVIAEHRLYFLRGLADQVLLLAGGRIAERFTGAEFFALDEAARRRLGLRSLTAPLLPPRAPRSDTAAAPAPGPGDLLLQNLGFGYRNRPVLRIDRHIFRAGRVTALIGDNGVGKSSLARVLCGLAKPDRGSRIGLAGRDCSPAALNRASYIVMQDVHRQLFAETVRREITLGARSGISGTAERLLDRLDLAEQADRHPLSLSGGQQQRLVIGSALAQDKQVYIFDEPTSGVDHRHLCSIADLLRGLADTGVVVIVITHDPELVIECADEIAELHALGTLGPTGTQLASQPIRHPRNTEGESDDQ